MPDINSTKIVLHNESIKPVMDYRTHVVLITGEKNKCSATLYTNLEAKEKDLFECYKPLTPFLNKYKSLYYKPDYLTEDLILFSSIGRHHY
jgi:hypothetical protein